MSGIPPAAGPVPQLIIKENGDQLKNYIAKRIGQLFIVLLGVSFFTFLLMYITPGDAAQKKLISQGIAVSQDVLDSERETMGLNRPFLVQYADWLMKAVRGDLGTSYRDGLPVAEKLAKAMRYTLLLALSSLAASLALSLQLTVLSVIRKNSIFDYIIQFFSFIGNSLPNFLVSILLMYFFCIKIKVLPVIADGSVQGLILPCAALSIPLSSRFIRQFRAQMLEEMGKEYVAAARMRGTRERYIVWRSVLHNSLPAITTVTALSVGTLFGGSVVIETMFRWPGLGKLVMDSITARDYPVIQGFVLFIASVYVLINLLADIICRLIDPRGREK